MKLILENHESHIQEELKKAQSSIHVAVAWLNFRTYYDIFNRKLNEGLQVVVIVNGVKFHQDNYSKEILKLRNMGAIIHMVNMPKNTFMHHKVGIIDEKTVITGSANWTSNSKNSFENVIIFSDKKIANIYLTEFKYILMHNVDSISLLQKVNVCSTCKKKMYRLFVLGNENEFLDAPYKVISLCDCQITLKEGSVNNLMENLNSIFDVLDTDVDDNRSELINRHYADILLSRKESATCHAIAIRSYEITGPKGEGHWVCKLKWKNKFLNTNIETIYDDFFDE